MLMVISSFIKDLNLLKVRSSGVIRTVKYENQFTKDEDPMYPFFNEDDPYEATKEEVLRAKWIEESK